jgi:hypothetical protein
MSQILLPPPAQPQPEPSADAPAATAVALPRRAYEPEPPKKPSAFWRTVKWPLRQLLKAIYLVGVAINRHRAVAVIALLIVLLLGGGTYEVYHVTHPETTTGARQTASGPLSGGGNTPFTISSTAQPPLAPAVIDFLHAWKVYDANELETTLSPQAQVDSAVLHIQTGATASAWQSIFDQLKANKYVFQQFIYSGGYLSPAGTANFTVQVIVGQQGGQGIAILTWYFLVGPDGQIMTWHDLTPTS